MSRLIDLVRIFQAAKSREEREESALEIHRELVPELRGYIRPRCYPDDVDDVQQETVVGFFRNLPRFNGTCDAQVWQFCYQVTRNKIADYWRRLKARPSVALAPEDLWRVMDATASDDPISLEERDSLEHALTLLRNAKPPCYDLLWQCYILEWDNAALGSAWGVHPEAARMRVNRCLKLARTLVKIGD